MDTENLPFSIALEKLKLNDKLARKGWNGKGMFIFLVTFDDWVLATSEVAGLEDMELDGLPWICMKTVDNKLVPWLASQTDILATDWCVV